MAGLDTLDGQSADSIGADSIAISKKETFNTNNGRVVYGGGGILPDVEIAQDPFLTPLEISLERKQMFFDFAVKYMVAHPDFGRETPVTDEMVKEFKSFIESKNFTYKTSLEVSLDKIRDLVKEEKKDTLFAPAISNFEEKIKKEKEADFAKSNDYLKKAIKREIVAKIAGERGVYEEIILKTDPGVVQAMDILRNKTEYSKLLQGNLSQGQKPQE